MTTFTASKSDAHPTELARLKGARLVTAISGVARGATGPRAEGAEPTSTSCDILVSRTTSSSGFPIRLDRRNHTAGLTSPAAALPTPARNAGKSTTVTSALAPSPSGLASRTTSPDGAGPTASTPAASPGKARVARRKFSSILMRDRLSLAIYWRRPKEVSRRVGPPKPFGPVGGAPAAARI